MVVGATGSGAAVCALASADADPAFRTGKERPSLRSGRFVPGCNEKAAVSEL